LGGALKERKFLHDLSNPLAIGYGNCKIILTKLTKDSDSLSKADIIKRLEKAVTAFERANGLIAERREYLLAIDKEDETAGKAS
tara:strand:+ start:651 stop:902 length:252 start_codon:yes stop_codon:yes gene_type:complete